MSDDLLDYLRERGPRQKAPTDGEQAARCFEMFRRGKDLNQVVQQLSVTPEFARRMYREWRRTLRDEDRQLAQEAEREDESRRSRRERLFDRSLDAARDLARWFASGGR